MQIGSRGRVGVFVGKGHRSRNVPKFGPVLGPDYMANLVRLKFQPGFWNKFS